MDSSSHGPEVDEDAKVLKRAVPAKFEPVPDRVASAPAVLSHTEKDADALEGKSQLQPQQQKPALKKPDKLAPCPRCESLDTKFCYYNNYNINQPRHFCKNCQRYWTAGGTLRNVPVGAGRRKNKHGSLQARHGALPLEQQVRLEPSLSVMAQPRPPPPRSQSAPEQISSPLASSSSFPNSHGRGVSSSAANHGNSLHAAEAARRRYIPAEPQASISSDQGRSRMQDDPEAEEEEECEEPCTSSAPSYSSEMDAAAAAAVAATTQEVQSTIQAPALQPVVAGMVRGLGVLDGSLWTAAPAPFGLFNGSWPFGYNVGWSGPPPGAAVACQPTVGGITGWSPPPTALWPGVCWGSALIPGMPSGMPPGMPPGLVGSPWMSPGWSVPWLGADAAAAATAVSKPPTAGVSSRLPIRPVLSKHPRDRFELERVESSLWVPKMVRLDDPGTAPRSSVWTSVGAADAPGSNFKAFLPVRKAPASSVTTSDDNTTTRVES